MSTEPMVPALYGGMEPAYLPVCRYCGDRHGERHACDEVLAAADRGFPKEQLSVDPCSCGHARVDHIYWEGACRPGFECPCEAFQSGGSGTSPGADPTPES